MTTRDLRRLLAGAPPDVRAEIACGWTATKTRNNHIRWEHISGALVFSASTPGDYRAWQNHLGELRRQRRMKEG